MVGPYKSQNWRSTAKEKSKNVVWTNEMDRCLSKILVEEAKKGHKLEKGLMPRAHVAAVRTLNEKFSLDLTKAHIRNRLKTWKKWYVGLKELLAHGRFKWDKNQKMVVANDSVWNNYIKEHPDAGAFRAKVFENYSDLCIIFGKDHVSGSYSRAGGDIDVDAIADYESIETGDAFMFHNGNIDENAENIRWTNEMNRYLSKILAEQIKNGNSISDSYMAAITAMNENFAVDLVKEDLRNWLKTWKKQYWVLKELLNQTGFKWDETQKMVMATDSSWDEYIEAYPEAEAFRGKFIENYHEFCILFGNDQATESLSRTSDEADLEVAPENEGEVGMAPSQTPSDDAKEKGKNIIWTQEMDRCLTEVLVMQVKEGNKIDRSFKREAYIAAVIVLNERFGLNLTSQHVRNRLKTLKKQYGIVTELLAHNEFEWDEKRKMVVANDFVWNDYIKEHPDAKPFRRKVIQNYHALSIIIGNNQETGAENEENEERVETANQLMLFDVDISHNETEEGMESSSQQTRARPASSSRSKHSRKRNRATDIIAETMSVMAANIGRIADALTQNRQVNLDELFEMVKKIPGFDDDLIIEACEFLSFDEKKARLFLKLDEKLRKIWLLKRLRGSNG